MYADSLINSHIYVQTKTCTVHKAEELIKAILKENEICEVPISDDMIQVHSLTPAESIT
jgi:hypothetical protein